MVRVGLHLIAGTLDRSHKNAPKWQLRLDNGLFVRFDCCSVAFSCSPHRIGGLQEISLQQLHEQKRMLVATFEEQLAGERAETTRWRMLVDELRFSEEIGAAAAAACETPYVPLASVPRCHVTVGHNCCQIEAEPSS